MNLSKIETELLRQDLVDRIQLEQPAGWHEHPLLLPSGRGPYLGEPDRQPIDRLASELRPNDVVQPAVALFVRGQDGDGCGPLVSAGFDELGARLALQELARLGRLTQPRFYGDSRMFLDCRDDARA